jgi:hypothetical protein
MTTTPHDAAPADEPGRALYEQQIDARTQRWEDVPDAIRAYWNGKATPSRAAGTEAVQAGDALAAVVRKMRTDADWLANPDSAFEVTRKVASDLLARYATAIEKAAASPPSVAVAQEAVQDWTRFDALVASVKGCGDGSCGIERPVGMHTNGGCRCYRDSVKMQRVLQAMNEAKAQRALAPAHPEAAKDAERATEALAKLSEQWDALAARDLRANLRAYDTAHTAYTRCATDLRAALASSKSQGREADRAD